MCAVRQVLWGGLFALASLLRENAGARAPAARAAALAGLPVLLRRCLSAYQARSACGAAAPGDTAWQHGSIACRRSSF